MRLSIKVVTKSSSDRLVGWMGDALKVCVTAAPERGRANAAVVALLSNALGVSRNAVRIVSGARASRKTVDLAGVDAEALRRRIGPR